MCAGFGVWGLPGRCRVCPQAGENKVWAETVEAEVGPTDRSILMMTSMHECQRQRWSSSYGYYSYNQAGLGK